MACVSLVSCGGDKGGGLWYSEIVSRQILVAEDSLVYHALLPINHIDSIGFFFDVLFLSISWL